jgi:acetyl-CoA C-acetyltransferase
MIGSGRSDVVVTGGAESASRRPLRFHTAHGDAPAVAYDAPPFTPWPDRDPDMHEAADNLAQKLNITRADQDQWAVQSHAKAMAAADSLSEEIVTLNQVKFDPFTRKLTPALCARSKALVGSITGANTAVSADAAAFLVMVSEDKYVQLGRPSAVIIQAGVTLGADPCLPGLAPVAAIKACLHAAALRPDQLVIAEVMEAYAAQAIACVDQAELPRQIVNQHGGALARGHPIGASGAILAVHLFHRLRRTGGSGLAAIAAAGGLGTALILTTPLKN